VPGATTTVEVVCVETLWVVDPVLVVKLASPE
jgi:hypothetical protein